MTTNAFVANASVSTDALFRSWVANLIAALTVVGLVRTADTGQIDSATTLAPTANATSSGYAIFRLADSAQATYPIFIRLEFACQAGSTVAVHSYPMLRLTIGKATDGAGNLSGLLLPTTWMGYALGVTSASILGSTADSDGVASGGEGWVSLNPWINMGGNGRNISHFHLERTNGGQGVMIAYKGYAANGLGLAISDTTGASGSFTVRAVNYSTLGFVEGLPPVLVPANINGATLGVATSLASGAVAPVFPWVIFPPGLAPHQCTSIMSYAGGDAPSGTFQVTLGGITRTYNPIPLNDRYCQCGVGLTGLSNALSRYVGCAILWQ